MATQTLNARLVALMRAGSELQRAFIDQLTPAERAETGSFERWDAKDLVAHLVAWKARRRLQLEAATRGDPTPLFANDETNERTWAELSDQTWDAILAEETRVLPELEAVVERMSVDELLTPDRFVLPYQPAALIAARPAHAHIVQHLAERFIERGQIERAIALREQAVTALDTFPEFPELAAAPHYNLARHYASSGRSEHALEELRRAINWNPALAPYAPTEPEFEALRHETAFVTLISNAGLTPP
jgi:tetratricopeptide (TPR) repeat protein